MTKVNYAASYVMAAFAVAMAGCSALDHSPRALTKTISDLHDDGTIETHEVATQIGGTSIDPQRVETKTLILRAQSPDDFPTPGDYSRRPMAASEPTRVAQQPGYGAAAPAYGSSTPIPGATAAPPVGAYPPGGNLPPPVGFGNPPPPEQINGMPAPGRPYPAPYDNSGMPGFPDINPPSILGDRPPPPPNVTPLDVYVQETRTGRFMFGAGVNSDAGVTGQITIDERNFDLFNPPRSWDDFLNGSAFRGAGQGFRLEAQPGNQVQRYLVNFTEPYLFDTPVTLNASAFYFNRNYFDYQEDRVGGRLALGYRLTPDLSVSAALRAEDVKISQPRVAGVPELDRVLGSNDFYSGRVSLIHDTRDNAFIATEGHYLELAYEQGFGEFDFPRGELDYRQFFTVRERPDGSGKHILAVNARVGISGEDTPLFENYFAGGYSTLRGFSFRGASPVDNGVRVGGIFKFLGSVEYFFPITADDMLKGTVFCDFGTVEESVKISEFRVAPGFGILFNIPALGPAPLSINFAFPVAKADTDQTQVFSFFFGASR